MSNATPLAIDRMLRDTEVAPKLGIEVQTLRNWRPMKKGPPFVRIEGAVRYRLSDIEQYLERNRVTHD